jgi:hypothetical protein
MAQSLFSFDTKIISLSAPTNSSSITLSAVIQGVTNVIYDYNSLVFASDPFKVSLRWPGEEFPTVINDVYAHDSVIDPLSTFSPLLSTLSQKVISPKSTAPSTLNSSVTIYYEDGNILTFNIDIIATSDNIIDLNLDVLDIQNTNQEFTTTYNLQAQKGNVVFNITDTTPIT